MAEMIDVIDDDLNILKTISREEIRKNNLKHKTAIVILKNRKNQIYANQRNKTKLVYPLKWVVGAGGMVRSGESYEQAAKRELKEELGAEAELKFLMDFDYKDEYNNYKAKIYLATYDGEILLDKVECEQGKWVSVDKLKEIIKKGLLCPDTSLFVQKYLFTSVLNVFLF